MDSCFFHGDLPRSKVKHEKKNKSKEVVLLLHTPQKKTNTKKAKITESFQGMYFLSKPVFFFKGSSRYFSGWVVLQPFFFMKFLLHLRFCGIPKASAKAFRSCIWLIKCGTRYSTCSSVTPKQSWPFFV